MSTLFTLSSRRAKDNWTVNVAGCPGLRRTLCAMPIIIIKALLPTYTFATYGAKGHVPFDQNFRKFWFKIEWNRKFPEIRLENFSSPLEVVLFSGNLGILENSCSIWHFYPV